MVTASPELLALIEDAQQVVEYGGSHSLHPRREYERTFRSWRGHLNNNWQRLRLAAHLDDQVIFQNELRTIDALTTQLISVSTKESNRPLRRSYDRYHRHIIDQLGPTPEIAI